VSENDRESVFNEWIWGFSLGPAGLYALLLYPVKWLMCGTSGYKKLSKNKLALVIAVVFVYYTSSSF
jgi:hypothetical protein